MKPFEKLITLAVCVMPYTALRVGIMGLGEIIICFLFLYEIKKYPRNPHKYNFTFSKFWMHFIVICLLGLLYNIFILGHRTGTFGGMFFDSASYILILMSVYVFENHRHNNNFDIYRVLKATFLISGVFLSIVYLIGIFTPTIFGLPIKYYNYFKPLSNNLHQTAMFIVPFPFIGLFLLEKERKKKLRFLILLLIPAFFYMGLETGSFKAKVGLILGALVYFSLKVIYSAKGNMRKLIVVLLIFAVFVSITYKFDALLGSFIEVFKEEDIGEGRSFLYQKALNVAMSSPIVGLGPGPHVLGEVDFWDTHQTLLTMLIQSGILGLFLFIRFIFKFIRRIIVDSALIAAFIPISIYFLGGDILRRLPIWIMMLLFFYQINNKKNIQ